MRKQLRLNKSAYQALFDYKKWVLMPKLCKERKKKEVFSAFTPAEEM